MTDARVLDPDLPDGALGEQVSWIMDMLNGNAEDVDSDTLASHFSPDFLSQVSADSVATMLTSFIEQYGPFEMEQDSLQTSGETPPLSAQFFLNGADGTQFVAQVAVEPDSGLIQSFGIHVAPAASVASTPIASPEASPSAGSPTAELPFTDTDVSFQSKGDTIYGSVMVPDSATEPGFGALIISGSGPTDRNGNSAGLTSMNTNLNLAKSLANDGVTSLRYDKLGSGKTGMASETDPSKITATLFLQEADAALDYLQQQPSVDPSKVLLVGHSEGALFALALAHEMTEAGTPPAGLILVSPLSIRYLDLIKDQVTGQYAAAVKAGSVSQDDADKALAELDDIIKSLRTDGTLSGPVKDPDLAKLFSPSSVAFLAEIDKWDPAEYAADLPSDMPVLILHGDKDEQVTSAQVDSLMAGFKSAGNDSVTRVEIPNANHLMKTVKGTPNAAVDYANPSLPFSAEAVAALDKFVASLSA